MINLPSVGYFSTVGEAMERLTTLGVAVNLVTYLTATMHLGNATSANTVTNFLGTSFMLCLLGGFIADTFLGRLRILKNSIYLTRQLTKTNPIQPNPPGWVGF